MKRFINIMLISVLCLSLFGCGEPGSEKGSGSETKQLKQLSEPISKNEFLLDTICTVTLYEGDEKIMDDAFSYVRKYEDLLSRTIETSDVAKINKNSGIAPVKVDPETIKVIEAGIHYGDVTGGKFDITIEPISSMWNFGQENARVPEKSEIEAKLPLVNYKNIVIDKEAGTVMLKQKGQGLDLGAIAKGFIADRLKEHLEKEGVTSGVIDFGGNVVCIGSKPNGSPFKVGIQDPFNERSELYGIIEVADKSVVSSGIYERYVEKDGVKYHHILNPKTGMPYDNNIEQVTIISEKSVDGDGLSTSLFTLGVDDGLKLIDSLNDVEAMFITKDNKVYKSKNFDSKYKYRDYEKKK